MEHVDVVFGESVFDCGQGRHISCDISERSGSDGGKCILLDMSRQLSVGVQARKCMGEWRRRCV